MDNKLKHLELIQATISRIAGYSFLLKGWSVTLVVALFGLVHRESNPDFIFVSYFPTIIFWFLDGYFLWQERLFRALYDEVRMKEDSQIDFSMNTKSFCGDERTLGWSIFSPVLSVFYVTILAVILLILYFYN
jgi:hypothetical protein